MADNVLGALFSEQADAIREGLGDIGGITPAETPTLIRVMASRIGTSGGSVDETSVINKITDPDNYPLWAVQDTVYSIPIELGGLDRSTGAAKERDDAVRSADFIPVTAGDTVYFASSLPFDSTDGKLCVCCYDADKNFVGYFNIRLDTNKQIGTGTVSLGGVDVEANYTYVKFYRSDTSDTTIDVSMVVKGAGAKKAEFKKVYFADHGYEVYGDDIDDPTMHKLVIKAQGMDDNEYNIVEIKAPTDNPCESTLALMNWGNGIKQIIDISSMAYNPDKPTAEFVCQSRGGTPLPTFSVRFNDGQGAGRVKKLVVYPDAIPVELTATGLKVRRNNNYDNNGTDDEFVIVDLVALAENALPPVTEADNGKILKVVDGKWMAVDA